jgi:hypothetical protein
MKTFINIFLLLVIDTLVIGFVIHKIDPDPAISNAVVLLVSFAIVVNLAIVILLYFVHRAHAKWFIVNAVLSGGLMFFLFGRAIHLHQEEMMTAWEFNLHDSAYQITHWKMEDKFEMNEKISVAISSDYLAGDCTQRDNQYYLSTDSTLFRIDNQWLHGFSNHTDSIQLKKVEL